MELLFEWDTDKNFGNIRKHGLNFETAAKVFEDPWRLEFYDQFHSSCEDRYITIGEVDEVLFVVYTERRERIRLISARFATAKEKETYYDSRKEN